MDIEWLLTFCCVAEHASMAKASEFVGLTPSGVKRQLDTLEKHLKTKLYSGNPQGIILNGEGQELYENAKALLALFDQTIADVKGVKETIEGDLKVIITNNGAAWFSQHFQEFRDLYPGINLKLIIDERRSLGFSSSISGITVGLTAFKPPKNTSLIWIKLREFSWVPFVHPNYLETHGTPTSMADLDNHSIIGYQWASENTHLADERSNILLHEGVTLANQRDPLFITDDIVCSLYYINQGLAIGILPKFIGKQFGLTEILTDTFPEEKSLWQTLYFVMPSNLKANKRVMALKNFIIDKANKSC
ncbi:MAG: LysR family transcriptional regulator [Alphaproteobacteria bacterium]|nr:LysR family transcriptional regulator [Alphaproteobacteria bacterium]